MRITRHDSRTTIAVITVRGIGIAILDKHTIQHGTVVLGILQCTKERQLIRYQLLYTGNLFGIQRLIRGKQIIGERHHVEYRSFGTSDGECLAGEDGTECERVTLVHHHGSFCTCRHYLAVLFIMVVFERIAAEHLHTMRNDERVVQGIVGIIRQGVLGRTRSCIIHRRGRCRTGTDRVTRQTHLYYPTLVGFAGYRTRGYGGIAVGCH